MSGPSPCGTTGRGDLLDRSWVDLDAASDHGITERQVQVLAGYASGMSRDAICEALFLTRNTVRMHVRRAHHRLGVETTPAAVARLYDLGVFRPRCGGGRRWAA